jgi:type III secretion system-like peptide-binding chaperone
MPETEEQSSAPSAAAPPPAPPPPAPPGTGGPEPGATAEALPKPRPPGEPANIVKLREMIEAELVKLVDFYAEQDGSYVIGYQSARVFVVPAWLQGGATVIRIFSITNLDVPVSGELATFLMTKNLDFVAGAFALDAAAGAVWFNHNLLGEYVMPEELQAAIVMVAETADEYDDQIKAQFGGRLYIESPDDAIAPPSTPGYL